VGYGRDDEHEERERERGKRMLSKIGKAPEWSSRKEREYGCVAVHGQ